MIMKSKALAILISLAMVFTMIPIMGTSVYADDPAPPAPGIALGPGVLSIGSNTSGAATVHMAGTKWRVIGYGVNQEGGIPQVASSADTMTLIASENIKTDVKFRADKPSDANHYSKSNLKTEVDAVAATFSNGEKSGIAEKDLKTGEYTDQAPYTDGIAGDEVKGELLWPLSTQEAYYMDADLRKNVEGSWWTRSPGSHITYATLVIKNSSNVNNGYLVDIPSGLRPAFNFNLKSVIFTSAAAGGKSSGGVGTGSLKSVEPNSNNEWKLTLKNGHDSFKVGDVSTCDGKTVNIEYSGAVAKNGEYISAIVTDETDAVKYYGNLIEFAKGGSASGTAKVTIDGKMEPTDKLYVLNEQLNGDEKTDYSSALSAITIPATGHKWNAGKVTTPATTTATGVKTYTCTNCKTTKTEIIPKLAKKANPLKVKGKTATVKYKKLKKKSQTLAIGKVIKFTKKGQGKMSYKKASVVYTKAKSVKMSKKALKKYTKKAAKKITINAKTGKVTVKKGLKKGTYKVKVKAKAAGNANYKASAWKTVTFKIKVK